MSKSFVIAALTFYSTKDGGLKASFDRYVKDPNGDDMIIGFPMNLGGQYFDFRIYYLPSIVILGRPQEVMLKFLSPDAVIPRLKVGGKYTFWYNGRTIGEFTVLEIHDYSGMCFTKEEKVNELWMARGLRRPDFYYVSVLGGMPVACFVCYHVNSGECDCLCGIRTDPPLLNGVGGKGGCLSSGEATIYCYKDVFDTSVYWPCRAVILRRNVSLAGVELKFEVCDVGMLYKDWNNATKAEGEDIYHDKKSVDEDIDGILRRAEVLLTVSGRK